jgi:hypothetical protein
MPSIPLGYPKSPWGGKVTCGGAYPRRERIITVPRPALRRPLLSGRSMRVRGLRWARSKVSGSKRGSYPTPLGRPDHQSGGQTVPDSWAIPVRLSRVHMVEAFVIRESDEYQVAVSKPFYVVIE